MYERQNPQLRPDRDSRGSRRPPRGSRRWGPAAALLPLSLVAALLLLGAGGAGAPGGSGAAAATSPGVVSSEAPAAGAVFHAGYGGAPEEASSPEEADPPGRDLYVIHCANCHGMEGRGDGPMADVLKVVPPDLTLLASKADGTFPRHEVHRVIDGRREIRSHGRRQMPIWGLAFQERGRVAEQESDVQARIADLVTYLESIQRE